MSKTVSTSEVWLITGHGHLDPITVFWQDEGVGRGRVTIECYGQSWTSWWGAMGSRTIKQFFSACGTDYLFSKLGHAQFLKNSKGHERYLSQIIDAVKEELR